MSDSSDEFGVFDPTKHVSFDEKIKLSELMRKCSREKLTKIVTTLMSEQTDSVEDIGGDKMQLRLDCIELDSYLKCMQIINEPE